jgi:chorismate dehydratase
MPSVMQKVRISAVSYLNTKPFLYGIQNSSFLDGFDVELQTDIPSVCAEKLLNGEADLGLIPVAVIPSLKEYHIISDYCIGADGPVETVMLYSQSPLQEIEQVLLDYQSRTSVMLAKLLAREFWKISPEFIPAYKGYELAIKGKMAAVVIGDRTFNLNGKFEYEYDLSLEWQKYTGLPFVFALWVANKPLTEEFKAAFNSALAFGINEIDEVARICSQPGIDLIKYFRKSISYDLVNSKLEALNLFLRMIKSF